MGLFIGKNLPFVLGGNIAGTIHAVGYNVKKYTIGQHIYGQGRMLDPTPDSAGLQEYAILRPDFSALVPLGFTDDERDQWEKYIKALQYFHIHLMDKDDGLL